MIAKTLALFVVLAAAGTVVLLAPTAALAESASASAPTTAPGTSSAPGTAGAPGAAPATPPITGPLPSVATPEPVLVSSAGPVSLQAHAVAMLGHILNFTGSAPARDAHKRIAIERYETTPGLWVLASSTRANRRGAFVAHWRTSLLGHITVRAVVLSSTATLPSAQAAQSDSSQPAQVTVYQPALSTYFGPGFYGQQTACGQTMSPFLVGVANRTLPCGTLVEVSYGGRRLTVPVVDRGPYANGADWDLTQGAAMALGALETVHVGTLVVGSAPNTPTLGVPAGAEATAATGGAVAY